MTEKFITVGKLGKTRGVEGEIYVTPFTDFPDRFLELDEIFIQNKKNWETIKISSSRLIADRPVIKFENVNSIEDAARLTNRLLAIGADQVVELPAGMFYIFDLIGCEVFDNSDNKRLGKIVDVEQYPANDAYIIETDDKKRILFPAVKKFVLEVDVENKKVIVDPAGLTDI